MIWSKMYVESAKYFDHEFLKGSTTVSNNYLKSTTTAKMSLPTECLTKQPTT